MPIHKLILDDTFDDTPCILIAIHCNIEDYRLAYLLNKYLSVTLSRKTSDINYDNKQGNYSIFEWKDNKQLITWSLVSNIDKIEILQKTDNKSLFDNQEKIIKTFQLLPEHKTVNYFLKIDSEFCLKKEKHVLDSIKEIPQITIAYGVDSSKLKSNLIF